MGSDCHSGRCQVLSSLRIRVFDQRNLPDGEEGLEEAEEAPPLLPPAIDSPSPIPPLDEAAEAAAAATAAATATNGVSPLLTTNGLGMSADDSREALESAMKSVKRS